MSQNQSKRGGPTTRGGSSGQGSRGARTKRAPPTGANIMGSRGSNFGQMSATGQQGSGGGFVGTSGTIPYGSHGPQFPTQNVPLINMGGYGFPNVGMQQPPSFGGQFPGSYGQQFQGYPSQMNTYGNSGYGYSQSSNLPVGVSLPPVPQFDLYGRPLNRDISGLPQGNNPILPFGTQHSFNPNLNLSQSRQRPNQPDRTRSSKRNKNAGSGGSHGKQLDTKSPSDVSKGAKTGQTPNVMSTKEDGDEKDLGLDFTNPEAVPSSSNVDMSSTSVCIAGHYELEKPGSSKLSFVPEGKEEGQLVESKNSLLEEFLLQKIDDPLLVKAILQEKYCDAHIHFERICDNALKNNMAGYSKEFFDSDVFHYVDVMERPRYYLGSSRYEDWLGNHFEIESCIVRRCIGVHPNHAWDKYVLQNEEFILSYIRDCVGRGYFVGEIGLDNMYPSGEFGFNDQEHQESWITKCLDIVKEFDPNMKIPVQFHIRVKTLKHYNHQPELVRSFFDILHNLPSTAVIIWHGFSYGYTLLHGFLSRGDNYFVTFCGRDEKRLAFLENEGIDKKFIEQYQDRYLLESDAFTFEQLEESVCKGIQKFASVLFPGKSYEEVLKINRQNFNRAFYTFI